MIALRSDSGDSMRRSGSKLMPVPWTVTVQPPGHRLIDVHTRDLVHVHLDGVPVDESPLVDHAPVGDGDALNRAADRQGAEQSRRDQDHDAFAPVDTLQHNEDDADDQKKNRAVIDDPAQPADHDDLFARLEHGPDVAHRTGSSDRRPGRSPGRGRMADARASTGKVEAGFVNLRPIKKIPNAIDPIGTIAFAESLGRGSAARRLQLPLRR
jgi:hypothetical protein